MLVTKRNGSIEEFNFDKIFKAILKVCDESTAGSITKLVVSKIVDNTTVDCIQELVYDTMYDIGMDKEADRYYGYSRYKNNIRVNIDGNRIQEIEKDRNKFITDLQYYQFLSKYSKRYKNNVTFFETWNQTCHRTITWLLTKLTDKQIEDIDNLLYEVCVTDKSNKTPYINVYDILFNYLYEMKASPAMRIIQLAGPALDRCNVGCYNCAYLAIKDIKAFSEMLYILMQGTGCGFSVEEKYISKLPNIQTKNDKINKYTIQDSTEGWCNALDYGLNCWFNGEDVEYNYDLIRKEGTPLATKGGTASGPEPLRKLLNFCRDKINKPRLSSLDCHDICCMIGQIVQVGGVRRSSEISLSDLKDNEMRSAKSGEWWKDNLHRTMANNSAVYESKPDYETFCIEWQSIKSSGSGERGIFNRYNYCRPRNNAYYIYGTNPCGEILLRDKQFCNLSMAIARTNDTIIDLEKKVIIATIFGTIQSMLTNFNYLSNEWKFNCKEERLLGVDITGQMDCKLFRTDLLPIMLNNLKSTAISINKKLSKILGINQSTAITCVKPGGNSAVLYNCSSGLSTRFSKYQIRNVREKTNSPMSKFLIDEKVPHRYDPYNKELLVFSFPIKNLDSVYRNDMTAIEQLEYWKTIKTNWTEHNPSVTIYIDSHEWDNVKDWLWNNWDIIGGLSFLPKDNGIYQSAPNIEIDEKTYELLMNEFPKIKWHKFIYYIQNNQETNTIEYACTGDKCELG